ncbi:hypothetical protein SEA_TINYMINY_59 [Microbacterium phage TinyMiny]|nr:hypothetical protein SEA_TINYMINY_59 [Microbacterium phage TinyMiny]
MAVDMLTSEEFGSLAKLVSPLSLADAIRAVATSRGYHPSTITLSGDTTGPIDIRDADSALQVVRERARKRTVGEAAEENATPFGRKAMRIMRESANTYQRRNAVYKDNFLVVGRVMEALFPDGAPRLHDADDFNRWHIFELVIVKLTRYIANWDNPDEDSLVDMIPYLAILGAQDEDLREAIKAQQDLESRAARIGSVVSARRSDPTAPNYEADV